MDIRQRTSIPAWPLLAGLQGVLLLALLGGFFFTLPPRPPPLTERLASLDDEGARMAVLAAIAEADSGRALLVDDEQRATLFLQLLSQSAELQLLDQQLSSGVAMEGLQPVDATLSLVGDPYLLPIFLDGLQRQRAVNHILRVEGKGDGGSAQFTVRVRYFRPVSTETGWIAPRLAVEEPEHTAAAPLLEDAAVLAGWRRFQWEERALVMEAARLRRRVSRELAAPLIELRASGGRMVWEGVGAQEMEELL